MRLHQVNEKIREKTATWRYLLNKVEAWLIIFPLYFRPIYSLSFILGLLHFENLLIKNCRLLENAWSKTKRGRLCESVESRRQWEARRGGLTAVDGCGEESSFWFCFECVCVCVCVRVCVLLEGGVGEQYIFEVFR